MLRRTTMFQQALFIMEHLPNHYDRPKLELTQWHFGYVEKNSENVKLIDPTREVETVYSMIPDIYNMDLVIVPLSQIPPDFETESKGDEEGGRGNDAQTDSAAETPVGNKTSTPSNAASSTKSSGGASGTPGGRGRQNKLLQVQQLEEDEDEDAGDNDRMVTAAQAQTKSRAADPSPPPMRPPMATDTPSKTKTRAASISPSFGMTSTASAPRNASAAAGTTEGTAGSGKMTGSTRPL